MNQRTTRGLGPTWVLLGLLAACETPQGPEDECEDGLVFVVDACVDSQRIACVDAAPENASSVTAEVEVTWDGTRWSDPAPCEWTCDDEFALVDGVCIDSQEVDCVDNAPEHAIPVIEPVEITYDGTAWSEPADCEWTCGTGYDRIDDSCLDRRDVACVDDPPANAVTTDDAALVTITFDGAKWSEPGLCPWACDPAFDEIDGECLSSRRVVCTDDPPEGATTTDPDALVTITWDGTRWSEPAVCAWICDEGLEEVDGECVEPGECPDGQHIGRDADGEEACVEDAEIRSCKMDPAEIFAPSGGEFEVFGYLETTGEPSDHGDVGVDVLFCATPLTFRVPGEIAFEKFSCVEMSWIPDFGAYAVGTALKSGSWEYMLAVSGDGGEVWQQCDREGIAAGDAYGIASIK